VISELTNVIFHPANDQSVQRGVIQQWVKANGHRNVGWLRRVCCTNR